MRTEERYQRILEAAEDAIISIDGRQVVVFFNQGAQHTFGYKKSEIIGQPLDMLLPQRFHTRHRDFVEEFASAERHTKPMSHRHPLTGRRHDGSEFPILATLVKTGDGEDVQMTVMMRDVSAAEEARKQLQDRNSKLEALNQQLMLERQKLAAAKSMLADLIRQSHS